MSRKPVRSLSTMVTVVRLGLAAVIFQMSGCGPLIFRLDETRTTGACPWTDANSAIACVSFRTNLEPLPCGFSDGRSHCSHKPDGRPTSGRSSESTDISRVFRHRGLSPFSVGLHLAAMLNCGIEASGSDS